MTTIQVRHESCRELDMVLAFEIGRRSKLNPPVGSEGIDTLLPQPIVTAAMPGANQRLWNRILGPKRYEIGDAGLIPMGQRAVMDGELLLSVEEFELGHAVGSLAH